MQTLYYYTICGRAGNITSECRQTVPSFCGDYSTVNTPKSTGPYQDAQDTRNRQHNVNFEEASAVPNKDEESKAPYTIEMHDSKLHVRQLKGMLYDADWEYALARSRAIRVEQKLLDILSERIVQEKRVQELETKCAELLAENKRLKGAPMADKQARCEDYFSEDEGEV
jgi:hypothetical protein